MQTRQRRIAPVVAVGLGALCVLVFVFFFNPTSAGFYPPCPTQALLGVDCPGCGSSRALYALTHGDIGLAADNNILLVVMVPFLLFWFGRWAYRSWTGTPAPPVSQATMRLRTNAIITLLIVVIVFAVSRNFLPYIGSGVG